MAVLPHNRINNWADCRAFIAADYHSRSGKRAVTEFLLNPVARFLVLLRLCEWQLNIGTPRVLRLPLLFWFRRLSLRLGFSISFNAIGPGLALPHYGPLMINQNACIGRNCRIHIGTVIAGTTAIMDPSDVPEFDAPIIGDQVYFGPGVKMNGPLIIGDDCVIGANSVVTQSFPASGQTLAGFPACILAQSGSHGMLVRGCDHVPHLAITSNAETDTSNTPIPNSVKD